LGWRATRLSIAIAGVGVITIAARRIIPENPTTVGFAYLLFVLAIASTWGFVEAVVASACATLTFNFYFLPPVRTFTIADPQNWVAFFSFLTTSLVASRLSAKAKQRAQDAVARQQDVERLYSFSRAILLIRPTGAFARDLLQKLADIFQLSAAVLYDRHSGDLYRAGPAELEGLEDQLRDAALNGTFFSDTARDCVVTAVRLGSQPIAALALQGAAMPDAVLQGIANLIAIGLERARSQDLEHQVEAARRSEQLRTTLIDAMAHELKTPLTSVMAATTSLLAAPNMQAEGAAELLHIANAEAERLKTLIDNSVELARLDTKQIAVHPEEVSAELLVRDAVALLPAGAERDRIEIQSEAALPDFAGDRKLLTLAMKQILDNAWKYSLPETPITIRLSHSTGAIVLEFANSGAPIPPEERKRVFERFYRSPSVKQQIPGSGLGLSIADNIVRAHSGELTLDNDPGRTVFRMTLPVRPPGEKR
jgi:two-component system sensor histidine kinase KdpD